MKRVLSIVLAIALVASLMMLMAACDDNKDKETATKPSETVAATQAATQAPTQAVQPTTQKDEDEDEDEGSKDKPSNEEGYAEDELYGGITQSTAILNAQSAIGGKNLPSYLYQGYNDSMEECWIMQIEGGDGRDYIVYANEDGMSFYAVDAYDYGEEGQQDNEGEEYAGITSVQAIRNAQAETGISTLPLNVFKGNDYDGDECWVVVFGDGESEPIRVFTCNSFTYAEYPD